MENLNLSQPPSKITNIQNPILKAIVKFQFYPSIKAIQNKPSLNNSKLFSFKFVSIEEVKKIN